MGITTSTQTSKQTTNHQKRASNDTKQYDDENPYSGIYQNENTLINNNKHQSNDLTTTKQQNNSTEDNTNNNQRCSQQYQTKPILEMDECKIENNNDYYLNLHSHNEDSRRPSSISSTIIPIDTGKANFEFPHHSHHSHSNNNNRVSFCSTTSPSSPPFDSSYNQHQTNLFPTLSLTERLKLTPEEFETYKEQVAKPVYDKILKSRPLMVKCGFNEDYIKEFAFELADEEELKKTYLTTDWVETAKLLKKTRSITESNIINSETTQQPNISNVISGITQSERSERNSLLLPHQNLLWDIRRDSMSSIEDEVNKIVEEKSSFAKDFLQVTSNEMINNNTEHLFDDILMNNNTKNNIEDKLTREIKIKLIITEINAGAQMKTIRHFLSPVLHRMNVLPEIGWFHSAILIGKWRLDFNDSSIVVPRKLVSQAAIITTDIDSITTMTDLNRIIENMAKCICRWNRNIIYKQTGGDKVTTGNCQDFVEDLLSSIGVRMNITSKCVAKFLKRLRKTGKCSLVFEMDKSFREKFDIQEKRMKFKTHEQLDLFIFKLLEICPNFATEYSDEWMLLQCFDRTYWLKHLTYNHIEEYQPSCRIVNNQKVFNCPFQEPEFYHLLKD